MGSSISKGQEDEDVTDEQPKGQAAAKPMPEEQQQPAEPEIKFELGQPIEPTEQNNQTQTT